MKNNNPSPIGVSYVPSWAAILGSLIQNRLLHGSGNYTGIGDRFSLELWQMSSCCTPYIVDKIDISVLLPQRQEATFELGTCCR